MENHHHKTSHPHLPAHGAFTQLMPELQHAVSDRGYHTPTPIQEQAIGYLLLGRDLIGCAQTGTGKTAAFVLPILQYLTKNPRSRVWGKARVLVLAPTRELAAQIGESVRNYGRYLNISHAVIFGGVGQGPQVQAVDRGVDILVATPGRLLDLMNQRHIHLDNIEIFVLDEADRMLDMGFIHDVRRVIAKLPGKRQTLFFSATMEPEVIKLSQTIVHNAVHISVTPDKPAVERIAQKVFFVDKQYKDALLAHLLQAEHWSRVLVFVQTKHGVDKVVKRLLTLKIDTAAIHGNKSQGARTKALERFKRGQTRVLVATDIAARGIDVESISHVVNYDLPNTPETYVHRIGRTARAGAGGDAVSFCSAPERDGLRSIEKLLRAAIPVECNQPYHSQAAQVATGAAARPLPKNRNNSHRTNQGYHSKVFGGPKNSPHSWGRRQKNNRYR
jgi:ATP-dependent RNA helicase RhlE